MIDIHAHDIIDYKNITSVGIFQCKEYRKWFLTPIKLIKKNTIFYLNHLHSGNNNVYIYYQCEYFGLLVNIYIGKEYNLACFTENQK